VCAVDKSAAALAVAKQNAAKYALHDRIELLQSDWFSALESERSDNSAHSHRKFDIIVANPPYLATDDSHLQTEAIKFEPITALVAPNAGLGDLQHIIQHAGKFLNLNGFLILEHGYDQATQVAQLLAAAGYRDIGSIKDLNGIVRASFAVTYLWLVSF
jgi:release factor glutamine methyltransferase